MLTEKIEMPEAALQILHQLEMQGFECYAVGGCVRDSLCGRTPHDWDLCTNALPEEVRRCFPDRTVLATGEKHGTVTVLWEGAPYEITTYRTEGAYLDCRRPSSVHFVRSLEEDLGRRDFTINAMAYHPARGLVDLYGGKADLAQGVLRCVGEPEKRFTEDALRILRGLRFAACYELEIAPETADAAKSMANLLRRISSERIDAECCKLLMASGASAARVLRLFPAVWTVVFPELVPVMGCDQNHPRHQHNVWEHTLHVLEAVPPDLYLRWAALFHDLGKPACKTTDAAGIDHFRGHPAVSEEIARRILHRLHADNRRIHAVCTLVQYHDAVIPADRRAMRRLTAKLGEDTVRQLLLLRQGDCVGQSAWAYEEDRPQLERAWKLLDDIIAENACLHLRDLAVNGSDLIAAGVEKGPQVGQILQKLLQLVIDERLPNEKECLLEEAKKILKSVDNRRKM